MDHVKKPALAYGLTDGLRAIVELGLYLPFRIIKKKEPKGDGHPVLILPGFMATDLSTIPLRSYIHKLGYKVYGWGEGRNYAKEEYIELLTIRMKNIYRKHREPLTLIGWSLGGIFARQMAKENPKMIRQIIIMGTPIKGIAHANNAHWVYKLLKKSKIAKEIEKELLENIPLPAPVPTTSIYSKEDGIVPWQLCLEETDAIHQNVQVRGSHLGLGVNPLVLHIIKDRLKYTKENWVAYKPSNYIENLLVSSTS